MSESASPSVSESASPSTGAFNYMFASFDSRTPSAAFTSRTPLGTFAENVAP